MAIFYPSLDDIQKLKHQPEPGEKKLLAVLTQLPDSYEVYFQPFLNGDRPDVIIVKKGYGILVIEVKDWKFKNYHIDDKGHWILKFNNARIKSPLDQVYRYKRNLFDLHVADFMEKSIYDAKYWRIVRCAVYFSEFDWTDLEGLKTALFQNNGRKQFIRTNVTLWGSIIYPKYIPGIFESMKKSSHNRFGDEEYERFIRFLRPTESDYEQFFTTKPIQYTAQQKKLIVSEPREQWIKGVVGSGKTTVLAARAANAFNRVNKRILLFTYNITLKNYIYDKIARIMGKYDPNLFYIIHYDQFIATEMNNYGLQYDFPEDFDRFTPQEKSNFFEKYHSDINLFDSVKDSIAKFPVILIDETQDFKKAWLDIIKKYFLQQNGEYVLFSDEKQNIYGRQVSNKDITTNISQRPTTLKESIRSGAKLKETFVDYQQSYLANKYDTDDKGAFLSTQLGFSYSNEKISYYDLETLEVTKLFNRVTEISKSLNEHPKDIAVLGESIEFLRDFDLYYRVKTNEKTNPMFESIEEYWGLVLGTVAKENKAEHVPSIFKVLLRDEAFAFWPEDDNAGRKVRKLSRLLAAYKIEHKAPQDRHYKSNAIHKYNLLADERFREWARKFLSEYQAYIARLRKTREREQFLSYITNRMYTVRDFRKTNFWCHGDGIKLSTIHSFKGWEASTLFLIIEPTYTLDSTSLNELIYTSITRAKNNLVILNVGNESFKREFRPFFTKHIN